VLGRAGIQISEIKFEREWFATLLTICLSNKLAKFATLLTIYLSNKLL
jgi:hypothetical protein